ncbi:hypothetical protein VTP01DRAFT_2929 [Rhizomucor pusillus]|uniref:uncharacterized protein n=1 Tax=Rhizomucor pusillus TaxID=4840 RepID=UPI0037424B03
MISISTISRFEEDILIQASSTPCIDTSALSMASTINGVNFPNSKFKNLRHHLIIQNYKVNRIINANKKDSTKILFGLGLS